MHGKTDAYIIYDDSVSLIIIGILAYFMSEMGYPIAPLVIGVILGSMCDENLRRALMVSKGSFMPIFRFNGLIPERPVALILFQKGK